MWKWLGKIKNNGKNQVKNEVSLDSQEFLKMLGIDIGSISKDKLSEITYFTCLRLLSESVGKCYLLNCIRTQIKGLKKQQSTIYIHF